MRLLFPVGGICYCLKLTEFLLYNPCVIFLCHSTCMTREHNIRRLIHVSNIIIRCKCMKHLSRLTSATTAVHAWAQHCPMGNVMFYFILRCTDEVIIFSSYLRMAQALSEFLPFHFFSSPFSECSRSICDSFGTPGRGMCLAWYQRLTVFYSTHSMLGNITAGMG